MKKITSKIAILVIASLPFLGINSAAAAEFAIGVAGQFSGFYGVGKETSTSSGSSAARKTTEEAGAFDASNAAVFVELAASDVLSFGIEYIPEEIDTPSNKNVQDSLTNTVSASFNDHTTIYANIGLPMLGGAYLKVGYIMVDVATKESLGTGGAYPDVNTTGITAGLGYNHDLPNGIFVRAEVSAAQYDDVSAGNTNEADKVVSVSDMMSATAQIKLGKKF